MAALAVFLQAVSGNKFIGYLLMIVYLVARAAMGMLDLDHLLYRYNATTPDPYSDMNGYGHFIGPHLLLRGYWAAFASTLLVIALLFWPRGTSLGLRDRLRQARARLPGPALATLAASLLLFAGLGGWIFYNTNVLNRYVPGVTLPRNARPSTKGTTASTRTCRSRASPRSVPTWTSFRNCAASTSAASTGWRTAPPHPSRSCT